MNLVDKMPSEAIIVADKLRKAYWRVLNPRLYGAGVLLLSGSDERIPLLQTNYGDKKMWQLPGGGIGPEAAVKERVHGKPGSPYFLKSYRQAALRELQEETGINPDGVIDLGFLAVSYSEKLGRDTYVVYSGKTEDDPMELISQNISNEVKTIETFSLDDIQELNVHHAVNAGVNALRTKENLRKSKN